MKDSICSWLLFFFGGSVLCYDQLCICVCLFAGSLWWKIVKCHSFYVQSCGNWRTTVFTIGSKGKCLVFCSYASCTHVTGKIYLTNFLARKSPNKIEKMKKTIKDTIYIFICYFSIFERMWKQWSLSPFTVHWIQLVAFRCCSHSFHNLIWPMRDLVTWNVIPLYGKFTDDSALWLTALCQ